MTMDLVFKYPSCYNFSDRYRLVRCFTVAPCFLIEMILILLIDLFHFRQAFEHFTKATKIPPIRESRRIKRPGSNLPNQQNRKTLGQRKSSCRPQSKRLRSLSQVQRFSLKGHYKNFIINK